MKKARVMILAFTLYISSGLTLDSSAQPFQPANSLEPVTNTDSHNIDLLAHISGGSSHTIFVQGSYAYLGIGTALAVMDITDISHPIPVGYVFLHSWPRDVYVIGTLAYVTDGVGLHVIDVSDPNAPNEISFFDIWGHSNCGAGCGMDLAVSGDYVYIAFDDKGLWIVDVSDPSAPIQVGFDGGYYREVAVAGGYAYYVHSNLSAID